MKAALIAALVAFAGFAGSVAWGEEAPQRTPAAETVRQPAGQARPAPASSETPAPGSSHERVLRELERLRTTPGVICACSPIARQA